MTNCSISRRLQREREAGGSKSRPYEENRRGGLYALPFTGTRKRVPLRKGSIQTMTPVWPLRTRALCLIAAASCSKV